ncbi:MAG: hypothetical protein IIB04_03190 [Acidobacteria bacterium]|nr:hypothetical protein [Acidobacteriota bacterium]
MSDRGDSAAALDVVEGMSVEPISQWDLFRTRLARHRQARIAVVFLGLLFAVVFAAPLVTCGEREAYCGKLLEHPATQLRDPDTGLLLVHSAPSAERLFGTDDIGRDVLSRVIHGGRASLTVGLTTGLMVAILGTVVGALAGYYPGAQPLHLKLIYEPREGKIMGAQAVGGAGVDKRIDVIATAMTFGATVRDLAGVDLAYAPQFASAKDPVHMAAFAASNDLDGQTTMMEVDGDLSGKQVVDVRTMEEAARFWLPNSVNINLNELRDRLGELDPRQPTVTVCHSGLRAHIAARILMQHGFEDVRNLTGGMVMRQHAKPEEIDRGD